MPCKHILEIDRNLKTKAEIFATTWKVKPVCRNCGADLCRHHHRSLRGCMLEAGHEGKHYNPHSTDGLKWEGADGRFICEHADWVALVDQLGKR